MKDTGKREKFIESRLENGDKLFIAAFNGMISFYNFIDSDNSTNHCYAIRLIYNKLRSKLQIKKICCLTNMDDKMLMRYREKYLSCFDYWLNFFQNAPPSVRDVLLEIALTENKLY